MQPVRWNDIKVERIGNAIERRVLWGSNGTSARLTIAGGTHVKKHSHPAEQFTCILEGVLRMEIAGDEVTLQEGDMLVIPANVEHEAWSIVDTVVWDFFTEVREDWKLGQNQYLSGDQ